MRREAQIEGLNRDFDRQVVESEQFCAGEKVQIE